MKDLFLKLIENYELFTPVNVAEESAYKITMESCLEIFGNRNFFDIKRLFEKTDKEKIDMVFRRLHVLNLLLDIM